MKIFEERKPEETEEVVDYIHYIQRIKDMMLPDLYPLFVQDIIKEVGFGGGKALEIGCGPLPLGMILCQVSEWRVTGLDMSLDIIQEVKKGIQEKNLAGKYVSCCANAESMHFKDKSFQLVFSSGSLHHWMNPIQVFQEINRVLKPGGIAIIYDLNRETIKKREDYERTMSEYVESQYRDGLEESIHAAYCPNEIINLIEKSGTFFQYKQIKTVQYYRGNAVFNQSIIMHKELLPVLKRG